MTKARAIKIVQEFIKHKKFCVSVMNADSVSTDLEDIRLGMVKLAESDVDTLEMVLKELQPRKNDSKGKKKLL